MRTFGQQLLQLAIFTCAIGCGSSDPQQPAFDLSELLLTQQNIRNSERVAQAFSPQQAATKINDLKEKLANNVDQMAATKQSIVQTQQQCMQCFLELVKKQIVVSGGRVDDSSVADAMQTKQDQLQQDLQLCSNLEKAFLFHISGLLLAFNCSLINPFDTARWMLVATRVVTKITETMQKVQLQATQLCSPVQEILVQINTSPITTLQEQLATLQQSYSSEAISTQNSQEAQAATTVNALRQARRRLFSMIKP